eukprot:6189903-Pleurochrysis_carterae.AAC.6
MPRRTRACAQARHDYARVPLPASHRQLYATLSELELAKSAGASVSSEASAAWIDEVRPP